VQSIACDPNIWNAVMQNPAVTSFFESQLAGNHYPTSLLSSMSFVSTFFVFLSFVLDFHANWVAMVDFATADSTNGAAFAGSGFVETPEKEEKPESQSGNVFDFMGILQNLKLTVTEMVSRMSNFFQNIFPTVEKDKSSADADGGSFMDYKNVVGGSFMGLAVMVIMVVLMKRA
jgi:hypothetical protein